MLGDLGHAQGPFAGWNENRGLVLDSGPLQGSLGMSRSENNSAASGRAETGLEFCFLQPLPADPAD